MSGRCKTCRWWTAVASRVIKRRSVFANTGICGLIRVEDADAAIGRPFIELSVITDDEPPCLVTPAAFGCVLWEGRDE